MKLSPETYGIALICFFFLGGLYLAAALAEFPYVARLSDIPWLLPILNLATVSALFYPVYRGISPAGKKLLRDHPRLAAAWLIAWIVLASVLFAQNDQYTSENRILGIGISCFMVSIHGWSLITLVEKWPTPDRITWLMIAGLSFICAIIFVYMFAGLY